MLTQFSDHIRLFSRQARMAVSQVLEEVSADKVEIGRLVNKLSSFIGPADYSPRSVRQMEPIQREFLIDMFRDIDLRIKSEFDISNSLSAMSSAMNNVFGGELQKIENDIQYLDSYINNYSFISGEDDLYNASFIENFDSDENSFLNENSSMSIPDRNGVPFSMSEISHVDQTTGKLKYSSEYELSLSNLSPSDITSISYETNVPVEYISSDTGIQNLFNNINSKSWNITAKTPFIVKDSLLDSPKYSPYRNNIITQPSLEVAITIQFQSLIEMSRIRMIPNYTSGIQLIQLIIETEDSRDSGISSLDLKKRAILTNPVAIDKKSDIDFDQSYSVKSITLIFAQTNYVRTKITPVQSELNSKMISSVIKEIRSNRKKQHDTLQDYVIRFFLRDTEKSYVIRNKKLYTYNYTGYYPRPLDKTNFGVVERLSRNTYFSDLDSFNKFKNTSLLSNIIFSIISYTLGAKLRNQISSTYVESNISDSTKSLTSFYSSGMIPVGDSNIVDRNLHFIEQNLTSVSRQDAEQMLNAVERPNMYEYVFSMSGIYLFNKSEKSVNKQKRSVFVSKKMPTNGKPIKVKMLSEYFEELKYSQDTEAKDKTSIEFSISVSDFPTSESDWTSIIPYTESLIRSEALLTNDKGECLLRFEPLEESVRVYDNAAPMQPGSFVVRGSNIKINTYNNNNTYFAAYTPKYLNSIREVVINPNSLATSMLVTPNINGANGERFSGTGQNSRVRLSYYPYIDYTKFVNATYSSYTGTVTSAKSLISNIDYSNYSPVTVIFDDGTPVINITNYLVNNNEIESFYESEDVLFIHYGDSLVFNRQINKPFRVLYQYMPDSFRYRVVMRSLTTDDQNYSVDRLIFKFSTETRDSMLINLSKYDNLFRNKVN